VTQPTSDPAAGYGFEAQSFDAAANQSTKIWLVFTVVP